MHACIHVNKYLINKNVKIQRPGLKTEPDMMSYRLVCSYCAVSHVHSSDTYLNISLLVETGDSPFMFPTM